MIDSSNSSRREFLTTAMGVGITAVLPSALPRARAQDAAKPAQEPKKEEKPEEPQYPNLRIAFVGTGGICGHHLEEISKFGISCPCFCDVDRDQYKRFAETYPKAAQYQDYREMFDKEHKNFDAVMVGTPDHHHFPATMFAMQLGKHCYTQKPLTHTVWEARELLKMWQKNKLATQMGIQGHAKVGWRLVYEWVRSGLLGDIREVHTWTDRPIWPQGIERPKEEDQPPTSLNWDCWLGPAPVRPYKQGVYHPFAWRGWWDFGCGALGDMACHTTDGMHWALEPGHPTSIEPLAYTGINNETYPKASIIRWEYPAKGTRPAFTAYWYDGGLRPTIPADLEVGRKLPETGSLFVGSKATLMVGGDYGDSPRVIPEAKLRELGKPKELLERSPGHFKEWVWACVGEKPYDYPKANFSYAAPLTERVLLGNIALRVNRKLDWNGEEFKFAGSAEANQLLTKEYRQGWKPTA